MASWHPSRRLFAAGLGLSLAVHFGVGMVAKVTPVAGGAPPAPEAEPVEMAFITLPDEPPEPERPEPQRVELGLERSDADTDAWLGFAEPTQHQARESEVEQSALTPLVAGGQPATAAPTPVLITPSPDRDGPESDSEAAAPPPRLAPTPELPQSTPEPVAPKTPPGAAALGQTPDPLAQVADPAEIEPASLLDILVPPTPAPTVEATEVPPAPSESPALDPPANPQTPEPPRSTPDEADQPPASAPPEPSRSEAAQATQVPASADSAPGEGGALPGEKSPSESTPASLLPPIDVRPGRVAAAQGLEITTVRPVFDLMTMAMARPRSPTIVIEFGKDGAVRRARYLPGRTTGNLSVDQPLLDAIYRWTAKGEALDRLADEEDQTVSITMRILLR